MIKIESLERAALISENNELRAEVERLKDYRATYQEQSTFKALRARIAELEGSRDEWEAAAKHYGARVHELEGALGEIASHLEEPEIVEHSALAIARAALGERG